MTEDLRIRRLVFICSALGEFLCLGDFAMLPIPCFAACNRLSRLMRLTRGDTRRSA